ncbi:MAG: carboxy terminal-processing peptidase [Bacteroidales bacterium]|nr:carboxy terminal-processing peptidase [Bacteroidales bacterium]MCF8326905.1 carboxy terminal-processing peptidase [Bacteroidales bacterium]
MMKKKITALLLISFILTVGFAFQPEGDTTNQKEKEKIIGQSVLLTLNTGHYLDKRIDDKFSSLVFDMYIRSLDPTKKFLLQEDIDKLRNFKDKIDDQLKYAEFGFFNESVKLIEQRIKQTESIYKEVLKKPFDFEKQEKIELDPDKSDYAANREELKEEWRKALKYQTMVRIKNMMDQQEKAEERQDSTYEEKSFAEMEKEAREKVGERQENWFENLNQLERRDRFSAYYNAVAHSYGPHTGYYPPKDKENFDINMSGKLEGIGAQLTRRDGYITVTRIVPGSASWKQGDLASGDKILKVAQEDEEPVDVVGMRLDDVVQLIRGKKGTTVTLTVEKPDGAIEEIPIERDVVVLEETYARSTVLQSEGEEHKTGYIHLPKFYVDFNDKNGRRCSEDVEKELEKLKDENIDGLILDLRNNGGGSLPDVVKIAGFFIDKGPVVQIKGNSGDPRILKDRDRGTEYDGPLMIMVNQGSASASEILAAAMQDYGRAVIVGSPSTFGKGTVQRFYDLDRVIGSTEYDQYKPLGSVKLTTQKFYRINGGATQLKGVTPDIVLPDRYRYVDVGEKEMDNAMPWSEIEGLDYKSWPKSYNIDKAKKKSHKRVKKSSVFDLIDDNAKRVQDNRENTEKTLNLEEFIEEQEKLQQASEELREARKQVAPIDVHYLKEDKTTFKQDTLKQERFDKWKKNLKKDVHLEEALHIMEDIKMKG